MSIDHERAARQFENIISNPDLDEIVKFTYELIETKTGVPIASLTRRKEGYGLKKDGYPKIVVQVTEIETNLPTGELGRFWTVESLTPKISSKLGIGCSIRNPSVPFRTLPRLYCRASNFPMLEGWEADSGALLSLCIDHQIMSPKETLEKLPGEIVMAVETIFPKS